MYAVPSVQNAMGYGCPFPQQYGRTPRAEFKSFSIGASSALHQKGSQRENSVSTRLGSTASNFEPSIDMYLPSDLQLFSNLLDGHLAAAFTTLMERDVDVAYLLTTALAHKMSLLEQTSRAVETLQTANRQVACCVLELRKAALTKDTRIASSATEVVGACVVSMKKSLVDMRASYVALLEQVHYLADCTAVELDYVNQCADGGFVDSTAALDILEEIRNFEFALGCLREAEDVMEGCFESWLYLHTIELHARELEKVTQRLQQDLFKDREHGAFPLRVDAFCAALEQLDEQCMHVLQC